MNKLPVEKKSANGVEATITVTKTAFNQTTEESRHIEIRPFAAPVARVGVKLGRTINLGNYESARVDVSVDVPCYVEEARDVYGSVMSLASDLLTSEVDKIVAPMQAERSVEELI